MSTKVKRVYTWSPTKFIKIFEKRGFTYGKFAQALQEYNPRIGKGFVHRWSRGAEPRASSLFAICEILKVDPWELSD